MTATFLKVNGSVKLGQHEGLLSYGPAFRPTVVGQPLKEKQNKKGPYTFSIIKKAHL